MDKAKVFWSGRSQAVRLPKKYRFDTDQVSIRREGNTVVLEVAPASTDPWAWLDSMPGELDADFVVATEEAMPMPDDEALHKLFK